MESTDNPHGSSSGAYGKVIYQDEYRIEEDSFRNNQDQLQVSVMGPGSRLRQYRSAALCLGLLGTLLLVIDIGLGIYYSKLSDGNLVGNSGSSHVSSELSRLLDRYKAAIQTRDDIKKQLETKISEKQVIRWDIEHQQRRSKEYRIQIEEIQKTNSALEAQLPLIKDGCKYCSMGWLYLSSMCYFIPVNTFAPMRSWSEAREICQRKGGDLAVIDNLEKQLAITKVINNNKDPSRSLYRSGFWFGLRDREEEGTWKWLDGTTLIEGYWNIGEPNDDEGEDCAATYPRENPFHGWNDAPCSYSLRWICEMSPRSVT